MAGDILQATCSQEASASTCKVLQTSRNAATKQLAHSPKLAKLVLMSICNAQTLHGRDLSMLPACLHFQLLQHLILSVLVTQVTQVDQGLVHGLVASQGVCILHGFPHNVAILILDNYDFLRLSHAGYHQASQLGEDAIVQVLAAWRLQEQ